MFKFWINKWFIIDRKSCIPVYQETFNFLWNADMIRLIEIEKVDRLEQGILCVTDADKW